MPLQQLGVAQMSRHQAVLVLGPHRSGTSAAARVLNLMGVDLGSEMLPPKLDNPFGFWEHRAIFGIHERFLSHLGSAWHDYRPLPPGWYVRGDGHKSKDQETERLRQELLTFLRSEFADTPLWGVKDPRLGRLLPLWHDLLAELRVDAKFVIVVRNPLEVVHSLRRRDNFSLSKCYLVYLTEMTMAIRHTEGRQRTFVSYERLIEDWRRVVLEVGQELQIDWPHRATDRAEEIDSFLRPSARHHRYSLADLHGEVLLPEWAVSFYEALEQASRGRGVPCTFSIDVYKCFSSSLALVGPELDELKEEIGHLSGQLRLLEGKRVDLERRAERAETELDLVQRRLASIQTGWAELEFRAAQAESELAQAQGRLRRLLASRLYRHTRRIRQIWYRWRYNQKEAID